MKAPFAKTTIAKALCLTLGLATASLALTGCDDDDNDSKISTVNSVTQNDNKNNDNKAEKFDLNTILANFKNGTALPLTTLMTTQDADGKVVQIRQGGYGSDAFVNPNDPTQFYALTDRGPNADVVNGDKNIEKGEGKAFPKPDYAPQVGLFQMHNDGSITLVKVITLKRPDGTTNATGLPNPANGATKEVAYVKNKDDAAYDTLLLTDPTKPFDAKTNPTKTDVYGIDSEGLAVMKDGSFWVSDEYGPHIVHYDANGKELARINPFTTGEGASTYTVGGKLISLPAEFKNRRANRGMEGLTITPDQKYLVGIMQSAMLNPDKSTKNSKLTRIVRINLATGDIEQFVYRQNEGKSDSNSGLVAIDKDNFYVIERDSEFPVENANAQKLIYKVSLVGATNLEALSNTGNLAQDDKLGITIGGKTLEQITTDTAGWDTLAANGIKTVSKSLVVDAVKTLNYPHEKFEGILLYPNGTLGLINDDDFGLIPQPKNGKDFVTQKYINKAGTDIDSDRIYLFKTNN